MIVYKSKQWIWFKKGTGEVMTKTKISFDLGIPFNCIQYVDVITNLQIDNALEPEIVNAIRQMEKEQKQALELLEKQVARFCNGQTKRHLIKSLLNYPGTSMTNAWPTKTLSMCCYSLPTLKAFLGLKQQYNRFVSCSTFSLKRLIPHNQQLINVRQLKLSWIGLLKLPEHLNGT